MAGPIPIPPPAGPQPPDADTPSLRRTLIENARASWISKLIDTTRPNNLLYFRSLKTGTVELDDVPPEALLSVIRGDATPIARLLPKATLTDKVDDTDLLLHPDLIPAESIGVLRKLRAIEKKAVENYEERGLETMYLAYGMATWTARDGGRDTEAPALLIPVRLEGKENRTALVRRGDAETNLALLHVLEDEYGCDVSAVASPDLDATAADAMTADVEQTIAALERAAATVPGFALRRRAVVANFSFQKMAMVRDLERNAELLAANDVIAAVAGDVAARSDFSASDDLDPEALDREPPESEFLIRDADSSQRQVIAHLAGGRSGVIHGPPGTGKSQTIANVIVEMVAKGKRVLFVAEKRAALEVVKSRLRERHLDHVVLDLHGAVKKSAIMADFASTLAQIRESVAVDTTEVHRDYAARRDALNAHVARMHRPRPPSNLTAYQLQGRLLAQPEGLRATTRWRGRQLSALTTDVVDRLNDTLLEAGGLRDLLFGDERSPWAHAAITSPGDVENGLRDTQLLSAHLLPRVVGLATGIQQELGLLPAHSLRDAHSLCTLVEATKRLEEEYSPSLYDLPLAHLVAALRGEGSNGVWHALARRRARRSAYKQALAARRSKAPISIVTEELDSAINLGKQWTAFAIASGSPRSSPQVVELRAVLDEAVPTMERVQQLFPASRLHEGALKQVARTLAELAADAITPAQVIRLQYLKLEMSRCGADPILAEIQERRIPADAWPAFLQNAWMQSCLDEVRIQEPSLASFDGRSHDRVVAAFQDLDRRRIELSVARARNAHAHHAIAAMNGDPAGAQLLQHEAAKRTRHLPLRKLIARAPAVVTAVKPCWMASPLAVSQLLDSGERYFDLVVFDEASQVFPEDAVTSLLRGRAVAVAGDRNQLPPTPFFVAADATDEDSREEAEGTAGFESVLDVMCGFCSPWALQWHYRSRDERLIAFSNQHLYGNSLVTFPGVGVGRPISHVLVNEQRGDLGAISNGAEVERVADLVVEHANSNPNQSLGVIAMGITHANRIEAEVERRRRDDPILDEFLEHDGLDRFFIKNLERVQGDERDCIILSIGYGKDDAGRLVYRFGPLLHKGGERRLNVAITRARESLTLVSSFSHLDTDPGRSSARGVELLRSYLEYAASDGHRLGDAGRLDVAVDPFELDVQQTLEGHGLELIPQYGASQYRIDLVAKHPQRKGALVLAIECDGASYHSAPLARDRDRLRQQHLEALGWTFCRIWSTDWFLHKEQEVERVVRAYHDAVRRFDTAHGDSEEGGPPYPGGASGSLVSDASVSKAATRGAPPGVPRGLDITKYWGNQLFEVVRWVQSDGRQRTDAQIAAEARSFLGLRNGARIELAFAVAILRYRRDVAPIRVVPPPAPATLPPSAIARFPVSIPPPQTSPPPLPLATRPSPSGEAASLPPQQMKRRRRRARPAPNAGTALAKRFQVQRALNDIVHGARACPLPGCTYVGPPGTCPAHSAS